MGAFERLEAQGIRIISGDIAVSCWAYGALDTGEVFYFSCNRQTADLWVRIYELDRHPTFNPDWHEAVIIDEITPGVALWPDEEEIIAHFNQLFTRFQRSGKAGRAKPMSEEMYKKLSDAELRDMTS
jgi:hypothetical protein